jgi:GTPase
VVESDILLHIIDVSNPNFKEQVSVVKDTLDEIGAGNRKVINVFNKVDILNDFELLNYIKEEYPDSVFISAQKGLNVESLLNRVKNELSKDYIERILKLKKDNYKLLSKIYKLAEVIEVKYLKTLIKVAVRGTKENLDYIEKLIYANIKL